MCDLKLFPRQKKKFSFYKLRMGEGREKKKTLDNEG